MSKCDEFSVGDEIIYIPYTKDINIEEINDGYIIECFNVKQTYYSTIKKHSQRESYLIKIRESLKCEEVLIIKSPFSNDEFTGTDIVTYIETDEYFIKNCRANQKSGQVFFNKSMYDKYKELLMFPLISDETEIFEKDDGVFIRTFCDELLSRKVKKYDSFCQINLPTEWIGLDILFMEAPK